MTLTLVLTAAVAPTVSVRVTVADPEQRARDYHAAIAAWSRTAGRLGMELVVVETTGAERSAFWPPGCPGRHVGFRADAETSARGKGAVEAVALDRALAEVDEGTVYKCTGRLWVANAERLVVPLAPDAARIRRTLDRTWVDGRFLGASTAVWRRALTGMAPEVDDGDGRYLEHVMADRLAREGVLHGTSLERFPARPAFVGRSGSTGVDYRSPAQRLKGLALSPLEALLTGPLARKLI